MRVKRHEVKTLDGGTLVVPFTCGHALAFPPHLAQALLQLGSVAWASIELSGCAACETEFATMAQALTTLAAEYGDDLPC